MMALSLLKEAFEGRKRNHHSVLYYTNRRRQMGLPKRHMTIEQYIKYQKAMRKAKRDYSYVRGV